MLTVNSLSNGLMARNGVPPDEVTTMPSGLGDQVIVTDRPLGGVELAAHGQNDRMPVSFGVGQGDPLPCFQRSQVNPGELYGLRHC